MLNVAANQSSAILKMTFGQMQSNTKYIELLKNIMTEVQQLAVANKVNDANKLVEEAMSDVMTMTSDGKTSMLQDLEAGRKTEVDIFAGTVVELGKKYNIPTPYNKIMKEMLEVIDNK